MIAKFGVRKMLFATPLLTALAAVTALALPASEVQADATVPTVDATANVEADTAIEVGVGEELLLVALNCTYYNNAAHTTIVGQFGYDCCNNRVAWGRKTAYSSCGGCFHCFPPPQ